MGQEQKRKKSMYTATRHCIRPVYCSVVRVRGGTVPLRVDRRFIFAGKGTIPAEEESWWKRFRAKFFVPDVRPSPTDVIDIGYVYCRIWLLSFPDPACFYRGLYYLVNG